MCKTNKYVGLYFTSNFTFLPSDFMTEFKNVVKNTYAFKIWIVK